MKVGIAGLGSLYYPRAFAECAQKVPGVELAAAATLGRSKETISKSLGMTIDEFAARYHVKIYEDPAEMVKIEGLSASFITSEPTRMHETVSALASLGIHLYIAKPMAADMILTEKIVTACQSGKIIATSGSTMRFDAGLRAAKKRIADGEIGDIYCVRVMHQHGNIDSFPEGDWYWQKENGGPELSLGWYVYDTVRWISSAEIDRVYAEYSNYSSPCSPFMDNGKAVMRLSSGVIASADLYFSTRWPFPQWEIEVIGSKGAIKTLQTGYECMLFSSTGAQSFHRNSNDMVLAEITSWLNACMNNSPTEVSIEDARNNLAVCFAARESAKIKTPVTISY